jgi:hypothetical protein
MASYLGIKEMNPIDEYVIVYPNSAANNLPLNK